MSRIEDTINDILAEENTDLVKTENISNNYIDSLNKFNIDFDDEFNINSYENEVVLLVLDETIYSYIRYFNKKSNPFLFDTFLLPETCKNSLYEMDYLMTFGENLPIYQKYIPDLVHIHLISDFIQSKLSLVNTSRNLDNFVIKNFGEFLYRNFVKNDVFLNDLPVEAKNSFSTFENISFWNYSAIKKCVKKITSYGKHFANINNSKFCDNYGSNCPDFLHNKYGKKNLFEFYDIVVRNVNSIKRDYSKIQLAFCYDEEKSFEYKELLDYFFSDYYNKIYLSFDTSNRTLSDSVKIIIDKSTEFRSF